LQENCEFVDCDPEELIPDEYPDGCYKELCMNECGDERCMLWYPASYDNASKQWIWYKEECAKTNTELLMEGVETGAVIAEAFEEPVTQALDAWCPEGGCFG
jgi:hypothetical protein